MKMFKATEERTTLPCGCVMATGILPNDERVFLYQPCAPDCEYWRYTQAEAKRQDKPLPPYFGEISDLAPEPKPNLDIDLEAPHVNMWLGPLEIFVHCDYPSCEREEIVWEGNPDEEKPPENDPLPKGWRVREGKTFCPEHA